MEEVFGKVFLWFVVDKFGVISFLKVIRGIWDCFECDVEVVCLVKLMLKWSFGKNKGELVNFYYNLFVNFKV